MAASCSDCLSRIAMCGNKVYWEVEYAIDDSGAAYIHWQAGQDHEAIYDIILALNHLATMGSYTHYPYYDYFPNGVIYYYLKNCIEAPEFTLEDLFVAYINATDYHRSAWTLLTDAYRASMYDKPFDLEYHNQWVRKFLSWR